MNQLPRDIYRHWIHSHEEDKEEKLVYRPSDYDFPRSRGRLGFEIREDGTYVLYDIAPTNGNVSILGRWTRRGNSQLSISFDDSSRNPIILEIISLDESALIIRQRQAISNK